MRGPMVAETSAVLSVRRQRNMLFIDNCQASSRSMLAKALSK